MKKLGALGLILCLIITSASAKDEDIDPKHQLSPKSFAAAIFWNRQKNKSGNSEEETIESLNTQNSSDSETAPPSPQTKDENPSSSSDVLNAQKCTAIVPLTSTAPSSDATPIIFSYKIEGNKLHIFDGQGHLLQVITRTQFNSYLSQIISPFGDIVFLTLPYARKTRDSKDDELQKWLDRVCRQSAINNPLGATRQSSIWGSLDPGQNNKDFALSSNSDDLSLDEFIAIMSAPSKVCSKKSSDK